MLGTMLGGRGKKHRKKECFLNDKDPLLFLMVGADFQVCEVLGMEVRPGSPYQPKLMI